MTSVLEVTTHHVGMGSLKAKQPLFLLLVIHQLLGADTLLYIVCGIALSSMTWPSTVNYPDSGW